MQEQQYVDELSQTELSELVNDMEEQAYEGHFEKDGTPIDPQVAKKRINASNERARKFEIKKAKDSRKKVDHRRASKELAKRLKKSAQRKNRK